MAPRMDASKQGGFGHAASPRSLAARPPSPCRAPHAPQLCCCCCPWRVLRRRAAASGRTPSRRAARSRWLSRCAARAAPWRTCHSRRAASGAARLQPLHVARALAQPSCSACGYEAHQGRRRRPPQQQPSLQRRAQQPLLKLCRRRMRSFCSKSRWLVVPSCNGVCPACSVLDGAAASARRRRSSSTKALRGWVRRVCPLVQCNVSPAPLHVRCVRCVWWCARTRCP